MAIGACCVSRLHNLGHYPWLACLHGTANAANDSSDDSDKNKYLVSHTHEVSAVVRVESKGVSYQVDGCTRFSVSGAGRGRPCSLAVGNFGEPWE